MKRRNFFKSISAALGAAVVVPEVLRGAFSTKPEAIEPIGTRGFDDGNLTSRSSFEWAEDYRFRDNLPEIFEVIALSEEGTVPLEIYLKCRRGRTKSYDKYFTINDTVLATRHPIENHNDWEDNPFVVMKSEMLISPLFKEHIRLTVLPVDPDSKYLVKTGDWVVRWYNLLREK